MLTTADPERFASEPWWMKGLDIAASPVRTLIGQPLKEAGEATSQALASPNLLQDPYSQHQLTQAVANFGARAAVVPKPAGSLGVFGGMMGANNEELAKMSEAMGMHDAGSSSWDIWKKTGWNVGPGGDWRFEIPDQGARLKAQAFWPEMTGMHIADNDKVTLPAIQGTLKLPEVLNHPDLYEHYPGLREYNVAEDTTGSLGHFNSQTKTFHVKAGGTAEDTMDTILHEVQHGLQGIESFPRGGQPAEFYPKDEDFAQNYNDALRRYKPYFEDLQRAGINPDRLHDSVIAQGTGPVEEGGRYMPAHQKILDDAQQKFGFSYLLDFMKHYENFAPLQDARHAAEESYHLLAGEVEARTVEARKRMRDWERQVTLPEMTPGYPSSKYIITKRQGQP
jgi:hypothetical protein